MSRVFKAIGAGLSIFCIITLLGVGVDALGMWLYGWDATGAGLFIGSVVGFLIGAPVSVYTYEEID